MKKLLVIGGNAETVGLIKKARELGYYTIVADYNPMAKSKRCADKSYDVDCTDVKALVKIARKENVDGILLGAIETLMMSYQKVCEELSFPCYGTYESFWNSTHKDQLKNLCKKHSIHVIKEFIYDEKKNATNQKIKYPVCVKPVDNAGSRGVSICYHASDLEHAISKAKKNSPSNHFLVEKYMDIDEVVLYYVVQNQEPSFIAMCDRYTKKGKDGVAALPVAYIYPSKYLQKFVEHSNQKIVAMLKDMGVTNGVLSIQCFVDKDGEVMPYDLAYRLNAAQEYYIVSENVGIDSRELLINFAMTGQMSPEDLSKKVNPFFHIYGCRLLTQCQDGTIDKILGIEEIESLPYVKFINPNYQEGETITASGTAKSIFCNCFIMGNSKEELKQHVEEVQKILQVLDENGQSMVVTSFDTNQII